VDHIAPSLMRCRAVASESALRLVVIGEVDLSNADDLDAFLSAGLRAAAGRPVSVDLIGVEFCAAAGVRVLARAARRARARGIELRFAPRSCAVDLALGVCGRLADIGTGVGAPVGDRSDRRTRPGRPGTG
jgi:anti-anti-sigma factor